MDAVLGRLTRDLALPVNPWLVAWMVVLCGAWLMPTHMLPWRSYHAEMAMVLALLPAALWAPWYARQPVAWPPLALLMLAAALVPFAQLAAGRIEYAGDAWIPAAYFVGFALAIVTGMRIEQRLPEKTAQALFAAFVIASILSTGLVLYQMLRLDGLGLLTIGFPKAAGYRPFGNLGQSNHLATLLVWGLIAVWWLVLKGHVRGQVAAGAAAFLLLGIVATQSRTAWVELALLGVAAAVWRGPLAARRMLPGIVALAAWSVALVLLWGPLTQWLDFHGTRSLDGELVSAGLRPAAWRFFIDAALHEPWAGWGWNRIALAQSAMALEHPSLTRTFISSHNAVIDLAVQAGIPFALLIVGALIAWFVATLRRVATPTACLLLLAIAVLGIHAMLEFPQTYTYFLLPAGLMIGVLDAGRSRGWSLAVPRFAVAALAAACTVFVAWVGVEYRMAERSLEQVRMERNRVGFARDSRAPDLTILTQLEAWLQFLRVRYTAAATPEQLAWMRRVVEHYPSDGNWLAFAVAAASNGRPDLAGDALARMCRVVPTGRCQQALGSWRAMAAATPAFAAVALPP